MPDAEAKGAGFVSLMKAVRERLSQAQLAELIARLPPDTVQLIERPPLPVEWIPNRHGHRIIDELYTRTFRGADTELEEIARRAMMVDLGSIYKVFIRFASPQFVIERSSRLWATYSRNNGTVRAEPTGAKSCDVFYQGIAESGRAFWVYQRGVIRGVLHATGLKDVRIELVRGGHDSPDAQYSVGWG